jgi:hypothetical protein
MVKFAQPRQDHGAYNATGNHWLNLRAVGRRAFDAKKLCKAICDPKDPYGSTWLQATVH